MSAQGAVAVVGEVVSALAETERYIGGQSPWAVDMFAMATDAGLGDGTSTKIPTAMQPLDYASQRQIVFTAQDVATRRIWQLNRTAYDLDPDLWGELGAVDEDMELPARVFAHLPHPDPFIVWPELPSYPLLDGTRMRSVGCFITGRSGVRIADPDVLAGPGVALGWPVSTHSPHTHDGDLVVTIVSHVEDVSGKPVRVKAMGGIPDCIIARVTLNLGGTGSVRVGDLIDDIALRYSNDQTANPGATFESTVRPMLRRIIATLLYLSATNADLRPLPARHNLRAARNFGKAKPPRVVGVGYTVGAGLRAWRKRTPADEPGQPTGRHVRPHVRRAHPHLYWTGEGRTIPRVKWLFPIRINAHQPIGKINVQPIRRRKETAL